MPPSRHPQAGNFRRGRQWLGAAALSAVLVCGVCGPPLAEAETQLAQAATAFDGNWLTTVACPTYGDAKGYTWQFYSQVRNGQLQGQHGTAGRPASVTLTGQIQPNGAATLTARGLTGDPDFTPGHSGQGSPIFYHVTAQFQGGQGSGTRQEVRPCTLTFARQ